MASCEEHIDDDGCLHLPSGEQVPRLELTASLLLDRSLVFYGPSGTGKTVLMKHCMRLLDGPIEQILVISPTEPSNQSYKGFVHPALILYRPFLADSKNPGKDDGVKGVIRLLERIWRRQEMLMAVSQRANNLEVLARLFHRIPKKSQAKGQDTIRNVDALRRRELKRLRQVYAEDRATLDERSQQANDKFKSLLANLYKKYIIPYREALWGMEGLDADEIHSLTYIKLNPRLLLYFDDCGAELKAAMNKDAFRKYFYQNRHVGITVCFAFQDDTDLLTNLRKNAFISFFTERVVCSANFNRGSNNFPKEVRAHVDKITRVVLNKKNYKRKFAYMREDPSGNNFYHVTVPRHEPKLFAGDGALCALASAVTESRVQMDSSNPYFGSF